MKLVGYGYEIAPRIDIIRQRFKESLNLDQTPLIPQLDLYSDIMTEINEELFKMMNKEDIQNIVNKLKKSQQRRFAWACKDLNKTPELLDYFPKDFQHIKAKDTKDAKKSKLDNFLNLDQEK